MLVDNCFYLIMKIITIQELQTKFDSRKKLEGVYQVFSRNFGGASTCAESKAFRVSSFFPLRILNLPIVGSI